MSSNVEDITKAVLARAHAEPAKAVPPPKGWLYYPKRDAHKGVAPAVPNELLESAPGLVGEIARWIKRGDSDAPNGLCLLSALSTVSVAAGRQFSGPTDAPLSLQMASLVPSGGGKDWAYKAPSVLLQACGRSVDSDLMIVNPEIEDSDGQDYEDLVNPFNLIASSPGNFTGDTAMINALWRSPILLVRIDEFGDALSQWTQSQSKEATIPALLRKAYSFGAIPPRAYAANTGAGKNLDEKRRKPLIDPFITLFAVSTPKQFYSALSGGLSENGTLNRFIIFDERSGEPTIDSVIDKYLGHGSEAKKQAPNNCIQGLVDIFNHGKKVVQGSAYTLAWPHQDRMSAFETVEHTKICFARDEVEGLEWAKFHHQRQLERHKFTSKDATDEEENAANAIARTSENLTRVAAICAVGDTPGIGQGAIPQVSAKHLSWATEFMELAEKHLKIVIGEKIEGEEAEIAQRLRMRLIKIYEDLLHSGKATDREGLYVSKRAITQSVSGRDRKDFSEAIKQALEDGLFIAEHRHSGKGQSKAVFLLWNGEIKNPQADAA